MNRFARKRNLRGKEKSSIRHSRRLIKIRSKKLQSANNKLIHLNNLLQDELERRTFDLEINSIRLKKLIEQSNDIILVFSTDGRILFINPYGLKLSGYTREEMIGKHFQELIHPDYLESALKFYRNQLEHKIPATFLELPIVTKRGAVVWLNQQVNFIERDGEIIEFTAISRDITERKKAEKERSNLYLRLKTILYSLNAGLMVEDEHRKVMAVNPEFCRLFNIPYNPEQIIGMDCNYEFMNSYLPYFKHPEKFKNWVKSLLEKNEPVTLEEIEMNDGKTLECSFIPVFEDGEGNFLGRVWYFRDISSRISAEENLRRSEEKYRTLIESMKLGFLEVNANWEVVKVYPYFCKMTGYDKEELLGKRIDDFLIPSAYFPKLQAQKAKRQDGQADIYEIPIIKKNGKNISVLIGGTPIKDPEGTFTGSMGVFVDLTEQKELQKELEIARYEADRARDAEKEFLANMSHEIRNPIHSIIGMTNLLAQTKLDGLQHKYANNIKYASEILLALVSNILDLSKIAEGKMQMTPQVFNFRSVVDAATETIKPRILGKPVSIEIRIDEDIPEEVIGDFTFFNQILLNLLGNAAKFTDEGLIRIEATPEKVCAEDLMISIRITDTGIGIEKEQLLHIFERFNQAGKANKSKQVGTGLGLPICKQLAELHGGCISVESESGQGSIFTVKLLFQKIRPHQQYLSEETDTFIEIPLKDNPTRILVVEDDKLNRFYLESTLEKWGFQYYSCKNGQKALQLLQEEKVDLILMDMRMPVMNGYQTTEALRSMKDNPNCDTPIVAMTASARPDEREKVLKAGMDYHLTKPFSPEQLLHAIHFFSLSRKSRELIKTNPEFQFSDHFNVQELQLWFGNNMDGIKNFFEIFVKNLGTELARLKIACDGNNQDDVGMILHKLKPSFALAGLDDLRSFVEELERKCKTNTDRSELRLLVQDFISQSQVAIEWVQLEIKRIEAYRKKLV